MSSSSPFKMGPIFQGLTSTSSEGFGDALSFSIGERIGGSFYEHFDARQGSLVFWVTPEWNVDELMSPVVLASLGGFIIGVDPEQKGILLTLRDVQKIFQDSCIQWSPGSTHLVILRWDLLSPLDANNHVSLRIDDQTYFGVIDSSPLPDPAQNLIIGAENSEGRKVSNALISGLTIYRRPLFDGTTGVKTSENEDELESIWNQGMGRDPTEITGSWDVLFSLPTNFVQGQPLSDIDSWAHPHLDNLLGVDGFMLEPAGSSWNCEGFASCKGPIDADQSIFGGGFALTDSTANEGLVKSLLVEPGDDLVIRAIGHSDGASIPRISLFDAESGIELVTQLGQASSTKLKPNVFLFTLEIPDGTTEIKIRLSDQSKAGTVFWHQVELYRNLVSNPSLEYGSGDPFIPTDWSHDDLFPGESKQDSITVHSGAFSLNLAGKGEGYLDQIRHIPSEMVDNHYYLVGGFFYWVSEQAPGISVSNGSLFSHHLPYQHESKLYLIGDTTIGWQHLQGIGRRLLDTRYNNWNDFVRWGGPNYNEKGNLYLDDAYMVHLKLVSPSTKTMGVEASTLGNELIVNGLDHTWQEVSGLTSQKGVVEFETTLGRKHGMPIGSCEGHYRLLKLVGDSNNFIVVEYEASQLIIQVMSSGYGERHILGTVAPKLHTPTKVELRYCLNYGIELLWDDRSIGRVPLYRPFGVSFHQIDFSPDLIDYQSEPDLVPCDFSLRLPGARSRDLTK